MLCAPFTKGGRSFLIRCCDVPEYEIAMAREGFRVGSDHLISPKFQGLLEIRRRRRVIDRDLHAMSPSDVNQMPNVTNVELWVGRSFDPQQPCPVEHFSLSVVACWRQSHLDADL